MSPKYKLTYLNVSGVGESIRFMLSYLEADWEDIRLERSEWAKVKPDAPWGKLPILEMDDKKLTQSNAILRYLGKQAGLNGKDDWENLQIHIIADTLTDLRMPIRDYFYETNPEAKKAKRETYINETLPFYLKRLEAVVKENGGYLANGKLSWADFLFTALLNLYNYGGNSDDVTAGYPHLHALKNEVLSIPQIAQWVAKRPKDNF